METITYEILQGLKAMFDDEQVAAILTKKGEDEAATDVLSILVDEFSSENLEVEGTIFFTDVMEGEEVKLLQFVLTLAEDTDKETMSRVEQAAALLNVAVETGSFCVNRMTNSFIYRYSMLFDIKKPVAELIEAAEINTAYAIGTASKYADIFCNVAAGKMSMEEIESLMGME